MQRVLMTGLVCAGCSWAVWSATGAAAADTAPTTVTVLARETTLAVDGALVQDGQLLVPIERVEAVTGFALKAQGLCAGEICIPIAPNSNWISSRGGAKYFNVSSFAQKVDQAFAVDADQKVWSFGAVPEVQAAALMSGQAPDFALMDRAGKTVRLSDFRGKKVLVLTWASWCACRFDLAGWQKIYEELKDHNFEIVAAAQDTGGMKIAGPWYDKAQVSFTALVDPKHSVSSLYQMVNVPTGVWVDEAGKIVRAPEVSYSKQQKILGQTIGDDRYAAGVRDWVAKGADSIYVVAPEKLRPRLAVRSASERQADAQFKLGTYFFDQGQRELAATHWRKSQELNPDSWNYHRQDWSFDKSKEMANWFGKVQKLGDKPYYDPVDFPSARGAGSTP